MYAAKAAAQGAGNDSPRIMSPAGGEWGGGGHGGMAFPGSPGFPGY